MPYLRWMTPKRTRWNLQNHSDLSQPALSLTFINLLATLQPHGSMLNLLEELSFRAECNGKPSICWDLRCKCTEVADRHYKTRVALTRPAYGDQLGHLAKVTWQRQDRTISSHVGQMWWKQMETGLLSQTGYGAVELRGFGAEKKLFWLVCGRTRGKKRWKKRTQLVCGSGRKTTVTMFYAFSSRAVN